MTVQALPDAVFSSELATLLPSLRRYAVSLTRSPDDGEDLLQETAVRAWGARARFDGTNLIAWLSTIMRNQFLDGRRRLLKRPRMSLDDAANLPELTSRPTQENHVLAREALAASRRLPVNQRRTLLLAAEGLDYAAMAHSTGVPEGTIRSRLSRARTAMASLPPNAQAKRNSSMHGNFLFALKAEAVRLCNVIDDGHRKLVAINGVLEAYGVMPQLVPAPPRPSPPVESGEPRHHKRWTPEEDRIIDDAIAQRLKPRHLKRMLPGRTPATIYTRLSTRRAARVAAAEAA